MRVAFVIPASVGDYFSAQVPHTGVAYISAVLKKNGIETKIIDMRLGYTHDEVFSMLDDFNPEFVGITLYSFGFNRSQETINRIKTHSGSYRVIIGGPHVAALKGQSLIDTLADFGVLAEGEFPMLELCQGKPVGEILGLIWRDGEKIVVNAERPFDSNLDDLPLPDYEGFELKKYLGYSEKHLPIITSRGCPYQCVFCSIRLSMGLKFRPRSPENVVDEIQHWYDKGWRSFEVDDDNFTLDMKRAEKICDMIIERGLKITWKCDNGIRADRLTKELLQKMKDAGCIYVSFGVEGGNNKMLAAMKKGEKVDVIINSIKMAKEVGLGVGATFIIGTPEETYEDFLDSLKIAQELPVDHVSFYNMVPYPGTEMYKWAEQHGRFVMDKETFLYNVAHWKNKPVFETENFTEEERIKAYDVAHDFYRKKVLEMKLGKKLGFVAWKMTGNENVERALKKIVLTPGPGRYVFNKIKRDPAKQPSRLVIEPTTRNV
ncbi:MAG TPA: radical SAM protein [archaeon]|nr:radical SAM protein [archaeon]